MKSRIWVPLVALVAVVAIVAIGIAASSEPSDTAGPDPDWPTTLTFATSPAESSRNVEENSATTFAILADELGLDHIELVETADYTALIDGLVDGTIDAAQLGGQPYVLATDNGAEISLAGSIMYDHDTEPGYQSYAIARADSDISSLEDLVGRDVCFVDPASTSGYLFPSEGLISAGIDPVTDLNAVFVGGHDAVVAAVLEGYCEAGFAYDTMVTDVLVGTGEIAGVVDLVDGDGSDVDDAEIAIIWKSQTIARPALVVSDTLPASFVEAFTEVVTTKLNTRWALDHGYCIGTPDVNDCAFGTAEAVTGYVATDDSFYDGVRQVEAVTQRV